VRVLSQDELVAPRLADYLRRHPEMDLRLARSGSCRYLTTDASDHFDHLAEIFMGRPIKSERVDSPAWRSPRPAGIRCSGPDPFHKKGLFHGCSFAA
jgi:hypothetical protein